MESSAETSAAPGPGHVDELTPLAKGESKGAESTYVSKFGPNFSFLSFIGPGVLCCLADTDAGCLIVAAESGARWQYSLLLLQVVLVPILFWAQELTVRLGVYTQKGHTACIKEHFGSGWAWFATGLLIVECVGAMVSEISGIAAVAELWGAARWLATLVAVFFIIFVVFLCTYRQIEIIGICLGLFELTFVVTMFMYHPSISEVFHGSLTIHPDKEEYLKLVTSNLGAVIMPWMIYFQQSAVVARGLRPGKEYREEGVATFVGSCLTQMVMIGTLVTMAAANANPNSLESVEDISSALAPQLGAVQAKVLVSLAFIGGSACAAFVVSLAASWAICEASNVSQEQVAVSLDARPTEAPFFYAAFTAVCLLGMTILLAGVDVIKLNVIIELMDGLLLPFALGFLFLLATKDILPPEVRLQGWWKYTLGSIFMVVILIAWISGVASLFS